MLFLGVIHNVNYHSPLFIGELPIEIHGEIHGEIPSCDEHHPETMAFFVGRFRESSTLGGLGGLDYSILFLVLICFDGFHPYL